MILISDNQYSVSPNDFTEIALIKNTSNKANKLKTHPGTCGNQNFKTSAHVETSTATVIAQLNQ